MADRVRAGAASLIERLRAGAARTGLEVMQEAADCIERLTAQGDWEEIRRLLEDTNPDMLLADGLESALVGVTENHHHPVVAVYDVALCREVLASRDGMSEEDADEYLQFNTLGAHVGPSGPLFVRFLRSWKGGEP